MTIADTRRAPAAGTGPLDEDTSNEVLFRAACAAEDNAIQALEAARQSGNPDAIAGCTAERDLFDRLAVELRANRRARCAQDAG